MKRLLLYLLPLALLFACTKSAEPDPEPEPEIVFDKNQVFEFTRAGLKPFNITCDIEGRPRIFAQSGVIPSLNYRLNDVPWVIEGKANNGVIEIVFPDEIDSLDSRYESTFTEGVRMAEIPHLYDNGLGGFQLCKWYDNTLATGLISIYYSEEQFSKFNNNSIKLNRGWNFVEVIYDNDGTSIGRISQDINDFLDDGYHWTLAIMPGGGGL